MFFLLYSKVNFIRENLLYFSVAGSGKCHADEVMDQIFTIFDKDESGCLDFVEFLLATSMTWSGTVEQKLR